jgi:hypothetical protein
MPNTYKVLLPILVNGEHGQGDEFEHQFDSPADENANLDSGLLEIVPRTYKVIGTSRVCETAPGDTFQAALRMGQEEPLIEGGHIERVDVPKKAAPKKEKEA